MPDFEYQAYARSCSAYVKKQMVFTHASSRRGHLFDSGGETLWLPEPGQENCCFALPILQVVHEALVSKKMFGKKSNVSDRKHSSDGVDVKAARVENIG